MSLVSKFYPTILIIDSGIGGFSVYLEIKKLISNLNCLYFFDNAGFPYGDKNSEFIINRSLMIINFMIEHYTIDLVVIACNSITTAALQILRQSFSVPIVGVVPAVDIAVRFTQNNIITVLSTRSTARANYTQGLISKFINRAKIQIFGVTGLAELAEFKVRGYNISCTNMYDILKPWLNKIQCSDILVLGCTHFCLLKREISMILPKTIKVLDSNFITAKQVLDSLMKIEYYHKSCGENKVFCSKNHGINIFFIKFLKYLDFKSLEIVVVDN